MYSVLVDSRRSLLDIRPVEISRNFYLLLLWVEDLRTLGVRLVFLYISKGSSVFQTDFKVLLGGLTVFTYTIHRVLSFNPM